MDDVHERATRLIRRLAEVPADQFTLGELLFICNRFRDASDTDGPGPVAAFDARDLDRLQIIARRLIAPYFPDTH